MVKDTFESNEAARAAEESRSNELTNNLVSLLGGEGAIEESILGTDIQKAVEVLMAVENMENHPGDYANNTRIFTNLHFIFSRDLEYDRPKATRDEL